VKFRFKAFGFHLLASACLLALVLGGLYLGWYRWPGWYLTGMLHVVTILAAVDLTLGPLVTFLIANPNKPRRELARDIAVIAAVQIVALGYGVSTLWQGRPLYYTYSEGWLQMVQASDLNPAEITLAKEHNPDFAPHWYSTPRWIWAPLPDDEAMRSKIVTGAPLGGDDVIQMPRYFKPWEQGVAGLGKQLKKVDDLRIFSKQERMTLKKRMADEGFAADQPNALFIEGRDHPVLAVFDRPSLKIKAILRAD
jgi:hypothetical protein